MSEPIILLDRYELDELIGTGGSARVYLGHDRTLQRRVAVKVLDSRVAESADPAAHARFLREGRSSARFSHPHAVATYDAGDDGDRLFIVMEYVDGTSLAQRIADEAPMPEREIVRVGTQLLSALEAAHDAGLIHRDVKPANVLLDSAGTVKLADFGIARRFDEITSALTVEGMVIGTRAYLAPEQARGLETGPPVDIYAVGAVLYEMATGQRPPMTPLDATVGADPRSRRADLSEPLATAISKALAGRPGDRFESAGTMAGALRRPPSPATMPVAATPVAPTATMRAIPATPAAAAASPPRARGGAGTTVMPAPRHPDDRPDRRSPVGWWVLAALALLVVAGGAIALARSDADGSGSVATQATGVPAAVATTVPPDPTTQETPATTAPPTTVPPTTVPPTTVPPTTVPPTTTPGTEPPAPPTPPELIPGFPATEDIDQFIDQLRDRESAAGKQSRKLGDGMRDVLKEDDEDRTKEIADLIEKIDEWLEKDEIDPVVAARAVDFLTDRDEAGDADN